MYEITAYYSIDHNGHGYGLAESEQAENFDAVTDIAHTMISNYGIVEIKNIETGKTAEIYHDEYFENFEGEFPVLYTYFE